MFCPQCGASNPDQNRQCSQCGASLGFQSTPQVAPPYSAPTSAAAIWSFVLALLSLLCCGLFSCFGLSTAIPAIICGHVALANINRSQGVLGGRGLAVAGLIIGYAAILVIIVFGAVQVLILIASASHH